MSKEQSLLPPELVESLPSEEALSWALCRCGVRGVHSEQESSPPRQEHNPSLRVGGRGSHDMFGNWLVLGSVV